MLTAKPVLMGLYLACALPVGIAMVLLVPPGEVPDEPAHMARAAGLLHGAVLAVRHPVPDPVSGKTVTIVGVKADASLVHAAYPVVTQMAGRPVFTLADRVSVLSETDRHQLMFSSIPNTATYFPAAYVPAALGLAVGEVIHATPYQSLVLARAAMLAAFLALGLAALWLASYGEALLLAVLLLPMSLFLAGSLSQDGVLIGMACLAAACLTRSGGYRWLGGITLALFLCAKPPYIMLLGFLLLPLRRPGLVRRCGGALLAAVPVLLWLAVLSALVIVPFDKPPYLPGPLWTGAATLMDRTDSAANLHILLAQPARLFTMPWQFVNNNGVEELREMIGMLGLLAIQFSERYYRLWGAALVIALAVGLFAARPSAQSAAEAVLTPLLAATIIIGTCWAMMVSMYISWTNVGETYIDGLQGRYLIPLLPFLSLAWPARRCGRALTLLAALPASALAIYDIGFLPLRLVTFFYAH
jgi:hypothetical protein